MGEEPMEEQPLMGEPKSVDGPIYNKCYLYSLLLTVSIGTIQFGYMIGSWNTASGAYGKKDGWDDDEQTNKVMII